MTTNLVLDTWDPTGTNYPAVYVTDAETGATVGHATVTMTIRRDDGTDAGAALAAPLAGTIALAHHGGSHYRVAIPAADSVSAGIVLGTVRRLLLDYRVVVSGTPENAEPIRQIVTVARKRDQT